MAVDRAESTRRGLGRSHKALSFGRQGAGATLRGDLSGAILQLAKDVEEKALRSAVYAGAKLLQDEMTLRAPVGKTGGLKDSIYVWRDTKQSVDGKQVYAIGPNKRKAPHWWFIEYGHWRVNYLVPLANPADAIKYGKAIVQGKDGKTYIATKKRLPAPVWVPPSPYIRPTADRIPDALRAAQAQLAKKVKQIMDGTDEPGI